MSDLVVMPKKDWQNALNAARAKGGITRLIKSNQLAEVISEIAIKSEPTLQEKVATENGEVVADEGFDGLSKVVVNVSVGGEVEELPDAEGVKF